MRADAVKKPPAHPGRGRRGLRVRGRLGPDRRRRGAGRRRVGTPLRHFPTKEALFEAIVLTKLIDLADAARPGPAPRTRDRPSSAFVQLMAAEGHDEA